MRWSVVLLLLCVLSACTVEHTSLLAVKGTYEVVRGTPVCVTQENVTIMCYNCGGVGGKWQYCSVERTLGGSYVCFC